METMAHCKRPNARKGRRYVRDRAAPYPAHRSGNKAIDANVREIDRDFIMKRNYGIIETNLTREQADQIGELVRQVRQGQAKLDAYIKQQNRPHLVARRWLRMQLIRLFN